LQFKCKGCGSTCGRLTDAAGRLSISNYEANAECEWLIPAYDSVILTFTSFDTQPDMDYVVVMTCSFMECGRPDESKIFSGTYSTQQSYVANSRFVKVVFISDSSISGAGFTASWTSVCSPHIFLFSCAGKKHYHIIACLNMWANIPASAHKQCMFSPAR
jgi:hypothetical protein